MALVSRGGLIETCLGCLVLKGTMTAFQPLGGTFFGSTSLSLEYWHFFTYKYSVLLGIAFCVNIPEEGSSQPEKIQIVKCSLPNIYLVWIIETKIKIRQFF